ncbi:MAG: ferrochelatase [Actinomycetota bacterium]
MTNAAVLLMAYGTPASSEDIERYYTHIRHGRPPAPELLEELTGRYDAIGGISPLLDISSRQASALREKLDIPVVLGMKHAEPFIEDAIDHLVLAGIEDIVGLVLAPHYSTMSIGQYENRVCEHLASIPRAPRFHMVRSWHNTPGYLSLLARRVDDALREIPEDTLQRTQVVFSAHSLPESIVAGNDPYPEQLIETARSTAILAGWPSWTTAWQSAGRTEARWLGPDLLDVLRGLAAEGTEGVVICPCGFVTDHLEILYDVDIEARALAQELGLAMVRTASPNDDPLFIGTLSNVVRHHLDRLNGNDMCGCHGHCRTFDQIGTAHTKGGM